MSLKPWRNVVILLVLLMACSIIVFEWIGNSVLKDFNRPPFSRDYSRKSEDTTITSNLQNKETFTDLLDRISKLRYDCVLNRQNISEMLPKLHTSIKYNLRFCKVPKAGSTFWMQILLTLNNFTTNNNTFGIPRNQIHAYDEELKTETSLSLQALNLTIVLVARNPFSRLYSAFVDKIFLPGFWSVATKIAERKGNTCGMSCTFADFIDYIMQRRIGGLPLNEHWKPINELCRPCTIPYNFILKQETYTRDVTFMVKYINMSETSRDFLLTELNKNHDRHSVKEITKVMIMYGKQAERQCLSFVNMTRRLWQAFQIQGYISDCVHFPEHKFLKLNYSSVQDIVDVFLDGVDRYKLSSEERMYQRNMYLHKAYQSLSNESVSKIIQMYDADFHLMGYSFVPPHSPSI